MKFSPTNLETTLNPREQRRLKRSSSTNFENTIEKQQQVIIKMENEMEEKEKELDMLAQELESCHFKIQSFEADLTLKQESIQNLETINNSLVSENEILRSSGSIPEKKAVMFDRDSQYEDINPTLIQSKSNVSIENDNDEFPVHQASQDILQSPEEVNSNDLVENEAIEKEPPNPLEA